MHAGNIASRTATVCYNHAEMDSVKIPRKKETQIFVAGLVLIAIVVIYAIIASMQGRDYMPFYWPHITLLIGFAIFVSVAAIFIDNGADLLTSLCTAAVFSYILPAIFETWMLADYYSTQAFLAFTAVCLLVLALLRFTWKEYFRYDKLLYVAFLAFAALVVILVKKYPESSFGILILFWAGLLAFNTITLKYQPSNPSLTWLQSSRSPSLTSE